MIEAETGLRRKDEGILKKLRERMRAS